MTEQPATKKFEPMDIVNDFGEAGGVAFCQIRRVKTLEDGSTETLEVNLTGRGHTAAEALENLGNGLHYAAEKGFTAYRKDTRVSQMPAPAPATSSLPVQMGTMSGGQLSSLAGTPAQATGGIIHATVMSTTPRADGKVNIEFFSAGHKYADINKVCTPDQAIAFLVPVGGFTVADFAAPKRYGSEEAPLNLEIKWLASDKLNSKGNPYKNIISLSNVSA